MADLAALTAETGDEFALFTKGGNRMIVRGGYDRVPVGLQDAERLNALGYRWSGHTHPGMDRNTLMSSPGDRKVIGAFLRQERSQILNSLGQRDDFGKEQ
jgi:hypothetical protein